MAFLHFFFLEVCSLLLFFTSALLSCSFQYILLRLVNVVMSVTLHCCFISVFLTVSSLVFLGMVLNVFISTVRCNCFLLLVSFRVFAYLSLLVLTLFYIFWRSTYLFIHLVYRQNHDTNATLTAWEWTFLYVLLSLDLSILRYLKFITCCIIFPSISSSLHLTCI